MYRRPNKKWDYNMIDECAIEKEYLEMLQQCSEEFCNISEKCTDTLNKLRDLNNGNWLVSTDDVIATIQKRTAAEILFSWRLGFDANYDHFLNPTARLFLEVDPEIYLKESMLRSLPTFVKSETIIRLYYDALESEHKDLFDDVLEYLAFVDTVIPKLAHFHGFLYANEFFSFTEPGYVVDKVLTWEYKRHLESMDSLFGSILNKMGSADHDGQSEEVG